jgi:hypothetical protein
MTSPIPADIHEGYSVFTNYFLDLTDTMQIEVKEWRSELKEAIQVWKKGGPEPDWQAFRDSANEICNEDGMPNIFES